MTEPICLLTRPTPQSQAFAARLPELDCVISAILRITPLEFDRDQVTKARGFVFTSVNSVPLAGPALGRRAFCVGPGTAEAAAQAGFVVTVGPGDAEGLIPMLTDCAGFLHLHGRHIARELPVPGIAVYDQLAQDLSDEALDVLAGTRPVILPLFSPRSAELVSQAVIGAQAPLWTVSISDRADRAFAVQAKRRRIAPSMDADGMLDAIHSLMAEEQS